MTYSSAWFAAHCHPYTALAHVAGSRAKKMVMETKPPCSPPMQIIGLLLFVGICQRVKGPLVDFLPFVSACFAQTVHAVASTAYHTFMCMVSHCG
jgi:hypothetical protein